MTTTAENVSTSVQCQNDECAEYERVWKVWLTRNQPGLLVKPNLICESCFRPVVPIRKLQHDN